MDKRVGVWRDWLHPWIWITVVASVVAAAFVWPDPDTFANTLDICDELFADFHIHYLPMASALPGTDRPVAGFFYPPLLGLALVPLGRLPETAAVWAWGLFQLGALALLVGAVAQLFRSRDPLGRSAIVLATLWSVPALHNLAWGQVSTFMSGLVIVSLVVAPTASAVLLALGVALKVYPLVFVPLRAATRFGLRWLGLWAGATAVLLLGVPALFMGFEPMAGFYGWVWRYHAAVGPSIALDPNSQFIPHVLGRWLDVPRETGIPDLWLTASRATGAAIVIFFATIAYLGKTPRWVPVIGTLTSIAFLIPTSWAHYFAHLAPCFAGLALYGHDRSDRARLRLAIRWMGCIGVLLVSFPMQQLLGGWRPYAEAGIVAAANLLLLLVVILAMAATRSSRPASPAVVRDRG